MGSEILTQAAPCLSIGGVDLEDLIEILYGLGEVLASPQDGAYRVHGLDRIGICADGLLVCEQRILDIAQELRQAACSCLLAD